MTQRIHLSKCTVERSSGDFCDAPSAEGMPFPICGKHASQLWRHINEQMEDPAVQRRARLKGAQRKLGRKSIVYYVQVGDLVKIGTTANLDERMRMYPPSATLLATEDGDESVESFRHGQFAHLLAGRREWFKSAPELEAHIEALSERPA